LAAILLLCPGSFHRLAESGDDTVRLHRLTTVFAGLGLLPFGICLAIDVFIVGSKFAGAEIGILAAVLLGLFAALGWYGIEWARRRVVRRKIEETIVRTPIKEKIRTLGTEVRVVLPGAQALLGFQFSAFLSDTFEKLTPLGQAVHFGSTIAMAVAVILLMVPAAYHRLATGGEDTREVDRVGSFAMLGAMGFLIFSMAGDLYLILAYPLHSPRTALVAASLTVVLAFVLWFIFPVSMRRRRVKIG
jgi:hypothetical protein